MKFDDSISAITFDPVSQQLTVTDSTRLQVARDRGVIASPNAGLPPSRTRTISLQRTTAEIAALETLFDNVENTSFLFTDSVGRSWTAWWKGDFDRREVAPVSLSASEYRITVSLFLEAVSSSPGAPYYANADVSKMSIQKSGATKVNFPRNYKAPQPLRKRPTTRKFQAPAFMATDAARYTTAEDKVIEFEDLSDGFVSFLEDYYVDDLEGAAHAFSLEHFRDATTNYRWVEGLALSQQGGNLTWRGSIRLREEV